MTDVVEDDEVIEFREHSTSDKIRKYCFSKLGMLWYWKRPTNKIVISDFCAA